MTAVEAGIDGAVFEWGVGSGRRFDVPFETQAAPPAVGDMPLTVPLAVQDSGKGFAVRSGEDRIGILSTSNPHLVRSLRIGWRFYTFARSRSGDEIGVGGDGGRTELLSLRGGGTRARAHVGLRSTNGFPEGVVAGAFSADGTMVAGGDVNHTPGQLPRMGRVALWEGRPAPLAFGRPRRGDHRARLLERWPYARRRGGNRPRRAHGSRDGRSRGLAPSLRLGPVANCACLLPGRHPCHGHRRRHRAVRERRHWDGDRSSNPRRCGARREHWFAPDGATFATTGGSDGLAKLWTSATQQQFGATFPGDPGHWGSAQFTPDGSRLVVAYDDGHGFVWPASLGAWESHACAVAGRNLTHEEWQRFVGRRSYSRVCPQFPVPSD